MSWDHERVEELLAAYALGGLDREEAGLAERALIEHVPGCASCRAALEGFRQVAGELALAAPPASPPDTLRARLRREIVDPTPRRPHRWAGVAAVAAGLVLAGGLSGWNLTLAGRLSDAETQQTWIVDAVSTLGHPEAGLVRLRGPLEGRLNILHIPGERRMYLVASGMRRPDHGVYRVWLVTDEQIVPAASFVPKKGVVMMPVEQTLEEVKQILITHEVSADVPTPAASPVAEATIHSS